MATVSQLLEAAAPEPEVLQIGIHDATTFEWRLQLPLPQQGELPYQVEAEFELPAVPAARSPWDHMRGITRLIESSEGRRPQTDSLDALRRQVLALTQVLKELQSRFADQCASQVVVSAAHREASLRQWITAASTTLREARGLYVAPTGKATPELLREKLLADEYVSVRMLDLLGEVQERLDDLEAQDGVDLGALSREVSQALDTEVAYRRAQSYPIADASDPVSLEHYVERAGRLKKHFREVLALDREAYLVDERVQAWLASFGALVAGIALFLVQGLVSHLPAGSGVGTGLVGVTLLTGLIYGARERIKELSRSWISGTVYRFYAQRVVRCRLPVPRFPKADEVVYAREWCSETMTARPDPLNPESGAAQRFTLVHHRHRGAISACHELKAAGVAELVQTFRYDVSPLLPMLSDTQKRIAAVDGATGRARFVDAPRRYYVPIKVWSTGRGEKHEARMTVVLDKKGVVRLEAAVEGLSEPKR